MTEQPTTEALGAANAEQTAAWNGDTGRFWADHAEHFDTSLRAIHAQFLAAAELRPGERVLDVGCGAGRTSLDAARAVAGRGGSVLGVDLSGPLLEVARQRLDAEGLDNVRFVQADAQVHAFEAGAYDVVLGRHSTMFFDDPPAAFANLARALRPGGRIVLLVWRGAADNEWLTSILGAVAAGRDLPPPPPGAPGPLALADPARVSELLTGAGFDEPELRPGDGPLRFGATADEATAFAAGLNAGLLADLDEAARGRALESLAAVMRDHAGPGGVSFRSGCWLVTTRRT
jgi:SAM-dependent methyltransferase